MAAETRMEEISNLLCAVHISLDAESHRCMPRCKTHVHTGHSRRTLVNAEGSDTYM